MRSSRSTRSRGAPAALAALAALVLLAQGCTTAETRAEAEARRALAKEIVGRWRGEPIDPPARVWWTNAVFDVVFSDGGDFSVVASTFDREPYDLHFEGTYSVVGPAAIRIEEIDLGGLWRVERKGPSEITMSRGVLALALRKRFGS